VALANLDVNNVTRANTVTGGSTATHKYSMNGESRKILSDPSELYKNELPDQATRVEAIRQHQKHHFTQDEISQMAIDYTEYRMTVYQYVGFRA